MTYSVILLEWPSVTSFNISTCLALEFGFSGRSIWYVYGAVVSINKFFKLSQIVLLKNSWMFLAWLMRIWSAPCVSDSNARKFFSVVILMRYALHASKFIISPSNAGPSENLLSHVSLANLAFSFAFAVFISLGSFSAASSADGAEEAMSTLETSVSLLLLSVRCNTHFVRLYLPIFFVRALPSLPGPQPVG